MAADAVDGAHFRTARKYVDVVADVGIGRAISRAFALDRQELLLQMQRDAAVSIVGPDIDWFW
jgi:hypothetical protein